jgi:hypothetical protein
LGGDVLGLLAAQHITKFLLENLMAEIKINGLTLQQEKAANALASGNRISEKKLAKDLGVTRDIISNWKANPRFKVRVLQIFDTNINIDKNVRYKEVNTYLKPIYKEIKRRLSEEDALENLPLKELLLMMTKLHGELRFDANMDKSYLNAGIKEFGEERNNKSDDDSEDDLLSQVSSDYEEMRKNNLSKKVVRLKA